MELATALGLADRELVAFVGAGGKKTAMARLVAEGTDAGHAVGSTTTTHTPPPPALSVLLAAPDDLVDALARVPTPVAFARARVPDPDRAVEKLRGFDPAVIDRVFASDRFDWLFVKADGARRREFKAPGSDEPQVPQSATTVVPVASVHAVGEPLSAPTVHRPERVAAITGQAVGDTITPETVASVLASPAGGLADVPAGARVVPLVNKADTPDQWETATTILEAAMARSDRIDRGVVAALETGRVTAVP